MGFFAKWYVLQAALAAPAPQTRLAVILVLRRGSAGYYLYVVGRDVHAPRADDAPSAGAERRVDPKR
jgi:NADH-quinone oxidoreductase subunit N